MACIGPCTCGCCAGISQETPVALASRPGLAAIPYRVGTYAQFKDTLLARISLSGQPLLRELRTRDDDDFSIALIDAFAVMGDVLTFYTERYGNESYLRTAVERQSVVDLAALVGYRPSPGVAASASLAFSIDAATGAFGPALTGVANPQVVPAASATVTVPAGTRVQSIPNNPSQLPQPFETSQAVDTSAAWNAITPRMSTPQIIDCTAADKVQSLILTGAVTNLKNGDIILLCPGSGNALPVVQKVTIATDSKTTQVDLAANVTPAAPRLPSAVATGAFQAFAAQALDGSVVGQILQQKWVVSDLVVAAQMNRWPIEQLQAAINAAPPPAPNPNIPFVMRQQAAGFGFNIPVVKDFVTSPPSDYDAVGSATFGDWHAPVIYLDAVYPQILPNSYIVLQTDPAVNGPPPLVATVTGNRTVTHKQFGSTAKVSMLTLSGTSADALEKFPIRGTTVLCQSEPLSLAQLPINDDIADGVTTPITLDQAYLGLTVGRTIALSGQRRDLPGVAASEIRKLASVTLDQGYAIITLDRALAYSYVRSTVQISANVAAATNGASVTETLGNGDATQTFQSFRLKQPPLTYTSAATASGIQSSLSVRVNGELWSEVPYFYGHGPKEHIFITRLNDDTTTTVTFGDGKTGARLPTGVANVAASYRYGIGTPGLVDANQISMMMTRPLGVRSATNPVASAGAADAETIDDARGNATLTIMTLDRIVSLEDYQDFARAFPGVSKALAVFVWQGQQRAVLLTVAGTDGAVVDPAGTLGNALSGTIAACSEPFVTVLLQSFSPVFFRIGGTVTIAPDRIAADMESAIEAALRSAFSFAARDFGQPVNLSEVIATIQDVDGVVGVMIDALYRSTDTPGPANFLTAALPQPGSRTITPAELLSLDPAPLSDLEVGQ
jgi:predicted phage baseplate assembly protein